MVVTGAVLKRPSRSKAVVNSVDCGGGGGLLKVTVKKATTTVGFLFYSKLLFFTSFFFLFSFFEFSFLRGGVGLFSPRKQGGGNREREEGGGVRIGGGTPKV